MEKYFKDNAFDGLTNEQFLRVAKSSIFVGNQILDTIKAHPTDLLQYLKSIAKNDVMKNMTQSDVDYVVKIFTSGALLSELKAEAAKRGISDLNVAIGQLNYQANYDEAMEAILNARKKSMKDVFVKVVIPILLIAGALYVGYVVYTKYMPGMTAKA